MGPPSWRYGSAPGTIATAGSSLVMFCQRHRRTAGSSQGIGSRCPVMFGRVLLVPQAGHLGPAAAALPAVGRGPRACPCPGPGDRREQPSLLLRLAVHAARRASAGDLSGQERLLHRSRCEGLVTRVFFRGVGQVPVDRSGGRASEAALRAGLKILHRGELLAIYPEGTRSPDGRLYRGKTGVARLALEAKVPVVPVAMIDTEKMQPPGRLIPRVMRPGVRIGEALDFSRYEGWRKTATSCDPSPTRSSTRSWSCPVRSMWTSTLNGPRRRSRPQEGAQEPARIGLTPWTSQPLG